METYEFDFIAEKPKIDVVYTGAKSSVDATVLSLLPLTLLSVLSPAYSVAHEEISRHYSCDRRPAGN